MTIKDVAERYGITADTIRYYERSGVIPPIHRNESGVREFTDEDVDWVEHAIHMRNAGLPIEMLSKYVRLCLEGDGTFRARRDLLAEARRESQKKIDELMETMEHLNYKIQRYEEAIETGVLSWDKALPECAVAKRKVKK